MIFEVVERGVQLLLDDPGTRALATVAYGGMKLDPSEIHLRYRTGRNGEERLLVAADDSEPIATVTDGQFLWELDGTLAVDLQKLRSDLYFVHAAVLGLERRGFLFVGDSGAGKSVLSWTLANQGLSYYSDELAPIDLEKLVVHPYPRALTLKAVMGPSLPDEVLRTERSVHVPTSCMPSVVAGAPVEVRAVFCLSHDPEAEPRLGSITPADAASRIYVSTLNSLAHPGYGLDGAIRIATGCDCFELIAGDLDRTADVVMGLARELAG